ncbi:MAG: DUF134 domain-containing protein [Sulfurimonas sp.]
MARIKSNRNLSFKPQYTTFVPKKVEPQGQVTLLHEEIEAIYLMDISGLYQEEAAKKMGISRTTFTRILKSARYKLSLGIISGYQIEIEDDKDEFVFAVCMDDKESFEAISPMQKYIFIYKYTPKKIDLIKQLDNPIYKNKQKLAIVLPKLFVENGVNIYIGSKIGEGLKNSLISKGIKPLQKSKIDSLEALFDEGTSQYM